MKTLKLRFELSNRANRYGLYEIYLNLSYDGIRKKIKTEVSCKDEHFGVFKNVLTATKKNIKKRVLTPGMWIIDEDENYESKNSELKNVFDIYQNKWIGLNEDESWDCNFDMKQFVNRSRYIEKYSVLTIIDKFIHSEQGDKKRYFKTIRNQFSMFLNHTNKNMHINFESIDKILLREFSDYLFINISGRNGSLAKESSVETAFKRLRAIFRYGKKIGLVKENINPFDGFKIREKEIHEYTYLLKDSYYENYYKIGYSTNVERRIKTLRAETPTIIQKPIKIWEVNIEKTLHKFYENCRLDGEWFILNKFQVRFMCKYNWLQ